MTGPLTSTSPVIVQGSLPSVPFPERLAAFRAQAKMGGAAGSRDRSQWLVTVELSPPKGVDASRMLAMAETLVGWVDAINVPDCQRAILKMSSLAASVAIERHTGLSTVWQLTCRDRNVLALQADILGAYALGIRTILALTGDPVQVGDHKDVAQQVFHLESARLLSLLTDLNAGNDATGKALRHGGTQFCVGAALNPLRLAKAAQQNRLRQKLQRGVDFFQTQPVYEPALIEDANGMVASLSAELGVPVPPVLVGLIPPANATMARMMNQDVAGVTIPDSFIELLERADDPKAESVAFCAEAIETLKPVAQGFHIMPVAMESYAQRLLAACFDPVGS